MKIPTIDSDVHVTLRRCGTTPSSVVAGRIIQSPKWLTDRQFAMTSDDPNLKFRVVDMSIVDDILLLSGAFKEVDTTPQTLTVQGSGGKTYTVTKNASGWSCTCPGFTFRKSCRHTAAIK